MAVVTPTNRPKSVHNRRVIEVLVVVACCQLVVEFSVGVGAFVIVLSKISFFPLDLGNALSLSQLLHRLRTVNFSGNRQNPCNWCGLTGLRNPNLSIYRKSCVIKMTHINTFINYPP